MELVAPNGLYSFDSSGGMKAPMMIEQESFQQTIQKKFLEIQSRNSSYTLRSYAQKLQISSGALSEILGGKRRVSPKLAEKVADILALDPGERSEIFVIEKDVKKKKSKKVQQSDFVRLTKDQFATLSEWYHFAILSLMNTKNSKTDVSWMAQRLSVPAPKIADAIARMVRLGLLAYDSSGKLIQTRKALRTTDDIMDMSIRRSHHGDLDLVRNSIDHRLTEERDLSSITLPVDMNRLQEAKQLIREFQDKMLDLVWNEESSEVYKMSIYLYPVSKRIEDKR